MDKIQINRRKTFIYMHREANKSSWLLKLLKAYKPNLVGEREGRETASVARTKGFFRKDKWVFRTNWRYKTL